ncbi:MAG: RelA/SpoT domain-containing protein [Bdellovibrionales bacterium]
MKTTELRYSKTKIDNAGELLKGEHKSSKQIGEALEVLSNWRTYHAIPLNSFAQVLKKRAREVNIGAVIAQRLKRTPSILLKLKNHKTMRLSTMQDIGGVRAILDSVDEVYSLLFLYKKSRSKHQLFSLNDYIETPKSDGYRSIHLVYKLKKTPSIFLEIQIRSYLQHIWATGVEVFGTLRNSSFKSGQGSKEWLSFFALLSSVFAIKENKPVLKKHRQLTQVEILKKTKEKIRNLQIIENLSVYSHIYKLVSNKKTKGGQGNYSLITLNSRENTISVRSFGAKQFESATLEYLQLERQYFNDRQINVVLVNSGDIKKLEISYPNYFMDTKSLVQNISLIMMDKFV